MTADNPNAVMAERLRQWAARLSHPSQLPLVRSEMRLVARQIETDAGRRPPGREWHGGGLEIQL